MDSIPNEYYLQLIDETKTTILEYASQDWAVNKRSQDAEVSSQYVPHHKFKIFKAVGVFDLSPAELFEYVSITSGQTDKLKKKLHALVKSWEVLREISQDVVILRTVTNSSLAGVVPSREFLDLVGTYPDYGGVYISCATSVDHPYPNDDKCVRGRNIASGILCFPVPGQLNKSKLVFLLQTDFKGYLPTILVEAALPDIQLSYFSNIRKIINECLGK